MTNDEIIAMLLRWSHTIDAMNQQFRRLEELLHADYGSPLCESVTALAELATAHTAARTGIPENLLLWYWQENDMGRKALAAGPGERRRPIATALDLINVAADIARAEWRFCGVAG